MKTKTNQPVFLDNGNQVDDSKLGGTKLYQHYIVNRAGNDITFVSLASHSLNLYSKETDRSIVETSVVRFGAWVGYVNGASGTGRLTSLSMGNSSMYITYYDSDDEQFYTFEFVFDETDQDNVTAL